MGINIRVMVMVIGSYSGQVMAIAINYLYAIITTTLIYITYLLVPFLN